MSQSCSLTRSSAVRPFSSGSTTRVGAVLKGRDGSYSVRARDSWYPNFWTFSALAKYAMTFQILGLIRFGGHLPKGEYDVDHDGDEGQADAAELHG